MRADAVLLGEPLEDREAAVAVERRVLLHRSRGMTVGLSSAKRRAKPLMSAGGSRPEPWICASTAWKL